MVKAGISVDGILLALVHILLTKIKEGRLVYKYTQEKENGYGRYEIINDEEGRESEKAAILTNIKSKEGNVTEGGDKITGRRRVYFKDLLEDKNINKE